MASPRVNPAASFARHVRLGALAALLAMALPAVADTLPFAQPRPQLYSAGQPSAAQLQQAADAGVTTVIEPIPTRDHSERMLRGFGADLGFVGATAAHQQGHGLAQHRGLGRVGVEHGAQVGHGVGVAAVVDKQFGAQHAGHRVGRRDGDQFVQRGQGFFGLALAAAGFHQRAQGGRGARVVQAQGVGQGLFGEGPHAARQVGLAQGQLGGGEVGVGFGGGGETLQRLVAVALGLGHVTFDDAHLRVLGVHALGQAQVARGLGLVTAAQGQVGQQHVGAQLVRVQHQGVLQATDGAGGVAFGQLQGGQAEMVGRDVGGQFKRALEALAGTGQVARLLQAHAQQVVGGGVVGLGGEGVAGGGQGGGDVATAHGFDDVDDHEGVFRKARKRPL